MTRFTGLSKILRFNWPWYVAAASIIVATTIAQATGTIPVRWLGWVVACIAVAAFWAIASIAVSHHVYDRSAVARGAWLRTEGAKVRRVAVFHAGQDEASAVAARQFPSASLAVFDFFDSAHMGSPSLRRARAASETPAHAIEPHRIPLGDEALDLGLVVFAAHEIRRADMRTSFLRELGRVLAPQGRVVLVEHLRDRWNFLAYGPGALHFLSRGSWLGSFERAGLRVLREAPCTRFVRVFELGRGP